MIILSNKPHFMHIIGPSSALYHHNHSQAIMKFPLRRFPNNSRKKWPILVGHTKNKQVLMMEGNSDRTRLIFHQSIANHFETNQSLVASTCVHGGLLTHALSILSCRQPWWYLVDMTNLHSLSRGKLPFIPEHHYVIYSV